MLLLWLCATLPQQFQRLLPLPALLSCSMHNKIVGLAIILILVSVSVPASRHPRQCLLLPIAEQNVLLVIQSHNRQPFAQRCHYACHNKWFYSCNRDSTHVLSSQPGVCVALPPTMSIAEQQIKRTWKSLHVLCRHLPLLAMLVMCTWVPNKAKLKRSRLQPFLPSAVHNQQPCQSATPFHCQKLM